MTKSDLALWELVRAIVAGNATGVFTAAHRVAAIGERKFPHWSDSSDGEEILSRSNWAICIRRRHGFAHCRGGLRKLKSFESS
jgi:hypothetical protein